VLISVVKRSCSPIKVKDDEKFEFVFQLGNFNYFAHSVFDIALMSDSLQTLQADRLKLINDHYNQKGKTWEDANPSQWTAITGCYRNYKRIHVSQSKAFQSLVLKKKVNIGVDDYKSQKDIIWDQIWSQIQVEFPDLIFLKDLWQQCLQIAIEHGCNVTQHVVSPLAIVDIYEDSDYPFGSQMKISGGRVYDFHFDPETLKVSIILNNTIMNLFVPIEKL
jgi:hypothetical protein